MFVDPAVGVTEVLSWLREVAVIGGIITFGWKARGMYQTVDDFAESITKHMQRMERFAVRMETNHLRHIESYLYHLAKDAGRPTYDEPSASESLIEEAEMEPPQNVDHPDASTL